MEIEPNARTYETDSYWWLIHKGCKGFDNNPAFFKKILDLAKRVQGTGLKELQSLLGETDCDFGAALGEGESERNSYMNSLMYYQYATLLKNDCTLLSENGTCSFLEPKRFVNASRLPNLSFGVVPGGAFSFKVQSPSVGITEDEVKMTLEEVINQNPTAPGIKMETNVKLGEPVSVILTAGIDDDKHYVRVEYDSPSDKNIVSGITAYVEGGASFPKEFVFNEEEKGGIPIACWTIDPLGGKSPATHETVHVTGESDQKPINEAPSTPSISVPPTAKINKLFSVNITRGKDPDGDEVNVNCTAKV